MGLIREMFRRVTSQPAGLDHSLIVASDKTESSDATYTSVTILSGATWTISSGVSVTTGSFTNNGTLSNNGTLTVETGTSEELTVSSGVNFFKTKSVPQNILNSNVDNDGGVNFFKTKSTPQNTMEDPPDV